METFSASLFICAGNSLAIFIDLPLKKRLSKQSRHWWFETPSHSLWRHCYVIWRMRWLVFMYLVIMISVKLLIIRITPIWQYISKVIICIGFSHLLIFLEFCRQSYRSALCYSSQITTLQWRHNELDGDVSIVCSTVCSGADQGKYQSSASLALAKGIHRWPVDSPHKGPVTRKMFPFDDVIRNSLTLGRCGSNFKTWSSNSFHGLMHWAQPGKWFSWLCCSTPTMIS